MRVYAGLTHRAGEDAGGYCARSPREVPCVLRRLGMERHGGWGVWSYRGMGSAALPTTVGLRTGQDRVNTVSMLYATR